MNRDAMSGWMKATVLVIAGVVGAGVLGGCSKNIATGRSQLVGMSRDQEISTGAQYKPQMVEEFGGEVQAPAIRDYVTRIGQSLAAVTEGDNPSLPWEFTLLNSDVINAFALPGGKVFISRGLAEQMTNEAQLAGVLGHEIGHVTARHSSERFAQQTGLGVGAAILGAVVGAAAGDDSVGQAAGYAVSTGGGMVVLKFSRDQESESDMLGMRYMSKVGYNPLGQRQVMEILARAAGEGSAPEFFATHPSPQTRIGRVQKLLDTTFRDTQNNPQYQLHEERFRRDFLAKLALLPDAPDKGQRETRLALGDPASWCVHCAAKRAAATPIDLNQEIR